MITPTEPWKSSRALIPLLSLFIAWDFPIIGKSVSSSVPKVSQASEGWQVQSILSPSWLSMTYDNHVSLSVCVVGITTLRPGFFWPGLFLLLRSQELIPWLPRNLLEKEGKLLWDWVHEHGFCCFLDETAIPNNISFSRQLRKAEKQGTVFWWAEIFPEGLRHDSVGLKCLLVTGWYTRPLYLSVEGTRKAFWGLPAWTPTPSSSSSWEHSAQRILVIACYALIWGTCLWASQYFCFTVRQLIKRLHL